MDNNTDILGQKSLSKDEVAALAPAERKAYKAQVKSKVKRRRKRLLEYTWRARDKFIPGFLLATIATAMDLLSPVVVGKILDEQIFKESLGAGSASSGAAYYFKLLGFYLALVTVGRLLNFAGQVLFQKTANHIGRLIQIDVFRHLQKLPIKVFDRMAAGKVVSRVTNDSNAIKMLYAQVIVRLITALVFSLGIFLSLAIIDIRLFFMALVPLPLLYLVYRDFKTKSSNYSHRNRRLVSELNNQLNENIQGMEVIQSLGRQERVLDKFSELNEEHFENNLAMTRLYSYSASTVVELMNYLSLAAILAYFAYASFTGRFEVPVGSLYIFIEYMRRLFNQFDIIMQRIQSLERAVGAADHVFEILDLQTIDYVEGDLPTLQGNISFKDVHFSYLENEPVLQGISFDIPAGSTAAFVGATGSGKSTIMNLLVGFYELDAGEILIDHQNLNTLPLTQLRRQMSLVLQDPFLFTGTLYSNIALDKKDISPEECSQALREVGGDKLLNRLSEGIMSKVENHGQGFSAGERQIISFARALVQHPKILILDEATANIDSETEALIQLGIEKLQENCTMLMIAHRLSTIKNAETIYVLDKGHIVERGTHQELMQKNGLYANMYEEQSRSVSKKRFA